jgi:hypothetical protein
MAPRFQSGDARCHRQARDDSNLLQNFRSLPEGTEPIELLNENAMGPVRHVYKIGARRQSICHDRLFVGIVLGLVANQDPILGRCRIYVIQFPSVSDGGNLPGRQLAHSLLLFGRGHSLCFESGSHQQIFPFAIPYLGRRQRSGIPISSRATRSRRTYSRPEVSFSSFSLLLCLRFCRFVRRQNKSWNAQPDQRNGRVTWRSRI